jgi:hypothetical protein
MPQSSPVEIRLVCRQNRQGRGYGRVLVRPVEARTHQQRDPATVQVGVHAISVMLDLMQPFRPFDVIGEKGAGASLAGIELRTLRTHLT